MKLIVDDYLNNELKEYLLAQKYIDKVKIIRKDRISNLYIDFNEKIDPKVILKHIEIFQKYKLPALKGFDKQQNKNIKKIKYIVDDICCEYCHSILIDKLFKNKYIESVKSNFEPNIPGFNIEFIIEYSNNYDKDELIKFINENK